MVVGVTITPSQILLAEEFWAQFGRGDKAHSGNRTAGHCCSSWGCTPRPAWSFLPEPHPLSPVGFHQQLSSRSAYPCNVSNAFRSIIHAWFSRPWNLAGSHSTECFTLQEKSADLFSVLTILIKKNNPPTNKVIHHHLRLNHAESDS